MAMWQDPTLLDDLNCYVNNDRLKVIQIYNQNDHIENNFESVNGKIVVLLYIGEYNHYKKIEEILSRAKNYFQTNNALKNYYIFVSAHKYEGVEEYHEYSTIFFSPLIYSYYSDKYKKYQLTITKKHLHFLSFNYRASIPRQSLFYFFNKFSLLEKSYFSYFADTDRTEFSSVEEIAKKISGEKNDIPWYMKNINLTKLHQLLPLKIDSDVYVRGQDQLIMKKFHEDSFCSIVLETYDDQMHPFFTEKAFRPIVFYHPFILHCNPGGLAVLQDMGFNTFNNWWDESYDTLSGNQRLEAIMHLTLEIGNWSLEKINTVYNEMLPVLEHNFNHLYNTLPKLFNDYKPKLYEQIKTLVEEKQKLF